MARRKKQYISDDDLDSSGGSSVAGEDGQPEWDEDPDEREERLKFSDPYGRQRGKRKRNGKEEALYGVWAEEEQDGGKGASRNGRGSKALKRTQNFVPSTTSSNIASTQGKEDSALTEPVAVDTEQVQVQDIPDAGGETKESSDEGESNEEGEDDDMDVSDSSSDSDAPRAKVARHRSEEDEEEAAGSAPASAFAAALQSSSSVNVGQEQARGGIGARSRGGIGSSSRAPAIASQEPASTVPIASTSSVPTGQAGLNGNSTESASSPHISAFASGHRERRAFLGSSAAKAAGSPMAAKATPALQKDEQKHFNKIAAQGGFGFKLLSKMGWSAGTGLGQGGEGIITPLESKLRPKAMGLAFEGFSERTKQAKQEEKRRKGQAGEAETESEDEWGRSKKGKQEKQKKKKDQDGGKAPDEKPAWKQKKPRKPKVQHLSYEEMVAGGEPQAAVGVGAIYDISGRQLTEAALSQAHVHDVPSTDLRSLPELQHNLAIMNDTTKADLDNLVREARISAERKKWLARESSRFRDQAKATVAKMERLRQLSVLSEAVQAHSQCLAYDERTPSEQLSSFSELFKQILDVATTEEYTRYKLDEIVISAVAPILKRSWMDWDVLASPTLHLDDLIKWRKAFRLRRRQQHIGKGDAQALDIFGQRHASKADGQDGSNDTTMTAFEALLWTLWMPRVRSAVNNEWTPSEATPVIVLYSSWQSSGLLPDFIGDNILDQLVMPKLKRAVADWNPPKGKASKSRQRAPALHHVLFPWLEHGGRRMDEIMDDAKRKVRGWLKTCKVSDGLPEGLEVWKDVITTSEWDNLVLQYIVPQLAAYMREHFTINPRQQDLSALQTLFSWRKILRTSMFSQLLEAEFFPKLLEALHVWLTSESASFAQVAEWYSWWKDQVFGAEKGMEKVPAVNKGFATALELMNQAISLGEDAKYRLKKAVMPLSGSSKSSSHTSKSNGGSTSSNRKALSSGTSTKPGNSNLFDDNAVTFRNVVEEVAAENNLIFLPLGKSHETTGLPLFKVSSNVEGKGGVTLYLRGDIIYAQDRNGEWKPVGVNDMVEQAKKKA